MLAQFFHHPRTPFSDARSNVKVLGSLSKLFKRVFVLLWKPKLPGKCVTDIKALRDHRFWKRLWVENPINHRIASLSSKMIGTMIEVISIVCVCVRVWWQNRFLFHRLVIENKKQIAWNNSEMLRWRSHTRERAFSLIMVNEWWNYELD